MDVRQPTPQKEFTDEVREDEKNVTTIIYPKVSPE